MKKSNKVIALILAMMLAFSSLPLIASASAIKDEVKTVDQLIEAENLGNLVEWLLKSLNTRKEKIVPTVLRLVYMFVDDIDTGSLDIMNADAEALSKVLIDYLNKNLPTWTKDITGQSWWKTVTDVLSPIGITADLDDVDGILKTVHSLAATSTLGDISSLNENALIFKKGSLLQKDTVVAISNSGNYGVIKALFQFLSDNTSILKKVIAGNVNLGLLSALNGTVNDAVKDVLGKDAIKAMLIDAVELDSGAPDYMIGDVEEDGVISSGDARLILRYAVGLEPNLTAKQIAAAECDGNAEAINSGDARMALRVAVKLEEFPEITIDYSKFTADEILAAAFLKLLTGKSAIDQAEANAVMQLSIYQFLETYAGDIYANLLLDLLNNDARTALTDLANKDTTGTIKKVLNLEYEFKEDTFDAYLGAGKGNMVAQLNNAVITLLQVVLTKETFDSLALETGDNSKLNGNLTKTFRFVLPLIKDIPGLGVDLSGFTTTEVQNKSAEDLAVAVLKLFFKGWFRLDGAKMAIVNKAVTLEQLGVLAACYATSNKEWVPMTITSTEQFLSVFSTDIDLDTLFKTDLTDEKCLDLIFEIGMETAAKALDYNKGTTYYTLPAGSESWTGADYLDDIVDWALNFIKGLPAVADTLTIERGVTDGNGGFYKINVILDSLFDLSFIKGCGKDGFTVDVETMLMDKFLSNLLDFDIEASVAILAENEDASIFNQKINEAAINLVDDLLTGLFEVPAAA